MEEVQQAQKLVVAPVDVANDDGRLSLGSGHGRNSTSKGEEVQGQLPIWRSLMAFWTSLISRES